jgi:ABC-type uncharacterized transport system substrate-binding protein
VIRATTIQSLLAALAVLAPVPILAGAPDVASAAQVAVLGPAEEPRFSDVARGLEQGLRDLGYGGGTVEIITAQVERGHEEGARAAVQQFSRQRLSVLFAIGSELARLARQVSVDLPIVFITPGDPVAAGLVASLAQPGGKMTAMTFEFPELSAKRLEFLKTINPDIRKVLVLYDPRDASPRQAMAAAREAAHTLGLTLIEREVVSKEDVTRGLEALADAQALLAVPGGAPSAHYAQMIEAANARRVPTIFHARAKTTTDALITYGATDISTAREAARLVDKILNGQDAGELPVERPTALQLSINLKTAKTLGVTIPPALLARADEVVE